jgi:hypothetical protein
MSWFTFTIVIICISIAMFLGLQFYRRWRANQATGTNNIGGYGAQPMPATAYTNQTQSPNFYGASNPTGYQNYGNNQYVREQNNYPSI